MAADIINSLAIGEIDVSRLVEVNNTGTVTISNVAPTDVSTATISAWLKVRADGDWYYIPMWN